MKTINFGKSTISDTGLCYVIAEIGHNHQGNLKVAMDMIKTAKDCGVNAVKFQKRDNKALYSEAMYNKPYDNENSFGLTYGEHREFLEFGWDEYVALKQLAEEKNVEFMCTAFEPNSVDFLERLGITSYKVASGDLTNVPLLEYIATTQKPIFLSTGASTLEEIHISYNAIHKYHDKICLLHTICSYPAEYVDLNLRVIQTLKKEFPEAIIGYSGHDNGILAPVIAYMLGATVVEKHFTLNHSWKGTDHKFSLEREGLRKQVRDLRRVDKCLGNGIKKVCDSEVPAKNKMGKVLYTNKDLSRGHVLSQNDIVIKSPGRGLPPYKIESIIGKKLKKPLPQETVISLAHLESVKQYDTQSARKQ